MKKFLIVYSRKNGLIEEIKFEGPNASSRAMETRFERENALDPDLEVIVLSADSESELRTTHARFFEPFGKIAKRLGNEHAVPIR